MAFKSEAQRRKFEELVSQGKMDQATLDEWNKNTPANIPERLTPEKPIQNPFTKMTKMAKVIK